MRCKLLPNTYIVAENLKTNSLVIKRLILVVTFVTYIPSYLYRLCHFFVSCFPYFLMFFFLFFLASCTFAAMSSRLSENKDPNAASFSASLQTSAFQRIHEKIGAPIIKEIEDYKKLQCHTKAAASASSGDGAPLIVL